MTRTPLIPQIKIRHKNTKQTLTFNPITPINTKSHKLIKKKRHRIPSSGPQKGALAVNTAELILKIINERLHHETLASYMFHKILWVIEIRVAVHVLSEPILGILE